MPLVSVVMPVRNAAATVARAVASIRNQTLADWELVAVDDGSTDGTRDWLRAEARREARLRLIEQSAKGIVSALNAGLAAARGRYVARMDADDESHPERLTAQAARLEASPVVGVVGSLVVYGGDRARNVGYARYVDWLNSVVSAEDIERNRFIESPLAHPSVMFRRELPERFGGYRGGDFPEDYELWLRWLEAGVRIEKVARPLLTWHDGPARLSRTDRRYDPEAFFRVKAGYLARWLRRAQEGVGDGSAREIWIWGAGRPTRRRAALLEEHGIVIAGYIDVDPKKIGRTVGGVPVIAPGALQRRGDAPEARRRFILGYVASRGARELIRADLAGRGYREGKDFLMCA